MPPWNESIDAMLMILPPLPCLIIWRTTACERKNGVERLIEITSFQFFALCSANGSRRMMPALLTRMSTFLNALTTLATIFGASFSPFERSALIPIALRPSFWIAAMVSSIGMTSTIATSAPASARPIA